ncbi:hydantoinase B/oxoprolinase family protein [Tunicatimonas pelagia]|uniref:hydantoinase B/oxoprolinase family protein n=1 Tax=Tunicatimonas pelagia TaxID=931531 RepID=UPI0026654236|nr:hydantoinase B/oxoprolinase family protein [Tunicatimonas pelagia]WKN43882.1 hydantoinase B/oxoprolinase family protein [Tunicatimonas pelagia]
MATQQRKRWKIWVDTGGTFTDCLAYSPSGVLHRIKVLSDSTLRGKLLEAISPIRWKIRQNWRINNADLLSGYTLQVSPSPKYLIRYFNPEDSSITLEQPLSEKEVGKNFTLTAYEEAPVLAARLATSTPLLLPLPPMEMRLGTTRGTNALLERKGAKTTLLVTKGFKDLLSIGTQQRPHIFSLNIQKPAPYYANVIEVNERLDAQGNIVASLFEDELNQVQDQLATFQPESVAIALMHSYRNPAHEQKLSQALLTEDFPYISVSSQLSSAQKILPRAATAVVDAYLAPIIHRYLSCIRERIPDGSLKVMSSAGGLADAHLYQPKDSLLSGPAGGVVGSAAVLKQVQSQQPNFRRLLSLDMGGTSTDVSRYDGEYDYQYTTKVGDAEITSPALAIETVAAGGGSICQYKNGALAVGPESAGAHPGPACYGQGGPLTITDVNLLLGRLREDKFGIPINRSAAQQALANVKAVLPDSSEVSDVELLLGFLRIANEKMTDAVRSISVKKGFDPTEYSLLGFGGAGGQHACEVASLLNIKTIIIPEDAGLLSAYGMGQAVLERFATRQVLQPYAEVQGDLESWIEQLRQEATKLCQQEGYTESELQTRFVKLFLRFEGQESTLDIDFTNSDEVLNAYRQHYQALFGHWLASRTIELESIKVVVSTAPPDLSSPVAGKRHIPPATANQSAYTQNGWVSVPVYNWDQLQAEASLAGSALVLSNTTTLWVAPNWQFQLDGFGNALLFSEEKTNTHSSEAPDAVQLALFTNRFTSIASGMGALLERTSFSVNVKERLDFSCALLSAGGKLIVNAPHIPVHLGSLGMCVRAVRESIAMQEGDVIITNHPGYGGSHLPDVTLISPVYFESQLIGYVANRAHHAEIGGSRPGSMPTQATTLAEEGVVISPAYLIRQGKAQWDTIRQLFTSGKYPTRNVEENLADLNGGLASIRWGIEALQQLAKQHGSESASHYMQQIEVRTAHRIKNQLNKLEQISYSATESLDDGSVLKVQITAEQEDHLTIDFTGSAPTHPHNFNATPAIVYSAVMYVLRLLLDEDVPLNEGLLEPVKIVLPEDSILNPTFTDEPSQCPAVVGGNTETSQRLVDTLLKALGLAASSQGTMNNVLFGNEQFGYYETIGGGSGAGNGFAGANAVHQHMTNTRITDPEVLEFRYPVRLDEFSVRPQSGGVGKWSGGNGIIRKFTFLAPLSLTVLTQHRNTAPYGMAGGQSGKVGRQWIIRKDGSEEILMNVDEAEMQAGDQFIIHTPGGGGYGMATDD